MLVSFLKVCPGILRLCALNLGSPTSGNILARGCVRLCNPFFTAIRPLVSCCVKSRIILSFSTHSCRSSVIYPADRQSFKFGAPSGCKFAPRPKSCGAKNPWLRSAAGLCWKYFSAHCDISGQNQEQKCSRNTVKVGNEPVLHKPVHNLCSVLSTLATVRIAQRSLHRAGPIDRPCGLVHHVQPRPRAPC